MKLNDDSIEQYLLFHSWYDTKVLFSLVAI